MKKIEKEENGDTAMPKLKTHTDGADLVRLVRKMKAWMAGGMLRTVFAHPQGYIHEVVFSLTFWYGYLNGLKTISDPTCGISNHQFKPIIGVLEKLGMEYHGCDINPANACGKICNVFDKNTLPPGDIVVYDPPYLPTKADIDRRGADYALKGYSLADIKRFYSREVFKNFYDKDYKVVIVKGADFFDNQTGRLIFFNELLDYKGLYNPKAIHIYTYKSPTLPLAGARVRRKYAGRRAILSHSNYLVLFKAGWEPPEQNQNGILERYIK